MPTTADRKAPKVISPSDPCIGLDSQGQQARAVRLWAQLPDRHRERRHRRCRGDAGAHLRRGRRDQDDDRPHRSMLRSEAEAAGRRHGLRHGQVPGLAGEGEEDHAAHSGLGQERAQGRHLLTLRLPLGQEARRLHLPQRQAAQTSGTVHDGRTLALPRRKRDCDACPLKAKCCPRHDRRAISHAISTRTPAMWRGAR